MTSFKISVIVPVYNTAEYLPECIESLLNQTRIPDEIILVDDGSIDDSAEICNRYDENYSFIRAIHKKNGGLGFARNTGMNAASGDYICFLDSDDRLENDCLEKLANYSESGEYDVIKGGLIRFTNAGEFVSQREYSGVLKFIGRDENIDCLRRMLGSLPNKHDSVEMGVTSALYKKAIIDQHNLSFPSEREFISEDLVFNIDYYQYATSTILIPYSGYQYRLNDQSLTKKYRVDRYKAVCKLSTFVLRRCEEINLGSEGVLRWYKTLLIYLWMCILQEKKSVSSHSAGEQYKNIKEICIGEETRNFINSYPIAELAIQQKVLAYAVKYKLIWLLMIAIKVKGR